MLLAATEAETATATATEAESQQLEQPFEFCFLAQAAGRRRQRRRAKVKATGDSICCSVECPSVPCCPYLSFAVLTLCPLRCSVNDAKFTQVRVLPASPSLLPCSLAVANSQLVPASDSTHKLSGATATTITIEQKQLKLIQADEMSLRERVIEATEYRNSL